MHWVQRAAAAAAAAANDDDDGHVLESSPCDSNYAVMKVQISAPRNGYNDVGPFCFVVV